MNIEQHDNKRECQHVIKLGDLGIERLSGFPCMPCVSAKKDNFIRITPEAFYILIDFVPKSIDPRD